MRLLDAIIRGALWLESPKVWPWFVMIVGLFVVFAMAVSVELRGLECQ